MLEQSYKAFHSMVRRPSAVVPFYHADIYTVAMYIVARMLLGVGIVFCIISGSAMIGELGYPKERPVLTSLFNSSYFIGSILASAITLKTVDIATDWSWRLPSLLQLCPSLLQIGFVLYVIRINLLSVS